MDKSANCSKCGAPIVFLRATPTLKNPAPKLNPIDRKSTPDGNIAPDWDTGTYVIVKAEERSEYPGPLHKSHYATCPKASYFKKR